MWSASYKFSWKSLQWNRTQSREGKSLSKWSAIIYWPIDNKVTQFVPRMREVPDMNFQENSSHEIRHKAENVYWFSHKVLLMTG